MQRYELSPNVCIVEDFESGVAMVYHTLYGNPRVVNSEGVEFLELFRRPMTLEEVAEFCEGNPEDVVKEFSEIYFLVEPGFDEKKFLHQKRTRHLGQVSRGQTVDRMGLAISDSCNFACSHCIHFQPSSNDGNVLPIYQKPAAQLNMSWKTAKQCIDHYAILMRANGVTEGRIHFGNAEPLINWPVIEQVLDYCGAISGLHFKFSINTNLALMTREIAETFKRHGVAIATSLDGTADANDAIRITKGGRGTFDLLLSKFDLLAEIGYPIDGFGITVTKGNFDLIDTDVIDLASARGMTSIAFDYDLVDLVDVPVLARVEKLIRFKKYAGSLGIDFFGTWDSAFRNLMSGSLVADSHAFCAAVEGRSIEFNVDGSIKVCSHTSTIVGHMDSFGEMFQEDGGLFKLVKERFPGTEKFCSGCAIEGPCGGQCHVTREVVSRSTNEEHQRLFSDMCDFYREVTEALIIEHLRSGEDVLLGCRQDCTL